MDNALGACLIGSRYAEVQFVLFGRSRSDGSIVDGRLAAVAKVVGYREVLVWFESSRAGLEHI
jgi:hypothetical protein